MSSRVVALVSMPMTSWLERMPHLLPVKLRDSYLKIQKNAGLHKPTYNMYVDIDVFRYLYLLRLIPSLPTKCEHAKCGQM